MKRVNKWINIALINLIIVAGLGLLLRAKMIFEMPLVNFKNLLHAHSHFAFSGWISLALLALMVFQLLPHALNNKRVYKWLLGGLLITAIGMLLSFPVQGYGAFSIAFSTLFILVTYVFVIVFLKDFFTTDNSKSVRLLTVAALICLVISSAGPFTLAYLMATKSPDFILYKNAIYTYLHLQYSGFFTLVVFALAFNTLKANDVDTILFARLLTLSVMPSMFASYLWSGANTVIYIIAVSGSLLSLLCLGSFFTTAYRVKRDTRLLNTTAVPVYGTAMAAFVLKMLLQSLTVIPVLGMQVFANRPVIIGFLHLVLLGFVSLYLLGHFIQCGLLPQSRFTIFSVWVFISGVVFNELVLAVQGVGVMIMKANAMAPWLLFAAACCLFAGALLITVSKLVYQPFALKTPSPVSRYLKTLSQS